MVICVYTTSATISYLKIPVNLQTDIKRNECPINHMSVVNMFATIVVYVFMALLRFT